jgi:hypothetical protein
VPPELAVAGGLPADAGPEGVSEPDAASRLLVAPTVPAPSEPLASPAGVEASGVVVFAAFERLASRASFLAQPDPLNTMEGTDSARRIRPPQMVQVVGPDAEMEWSTSTWLPHDSQT